LGQCHTALRQIIIHNKLDEKSDMFESNNYKKRDKKTNQLLIVVVTCHVHLYYHFHIKFKQKHIFIFIVVHYLQGQNKVTPSILAK